MRRSRSELQEGKYEEEQEGRRAKRRSRRAGGWGDSARRPRSMRTDTALTCDAQQPEAIRANFNGGQSIFAAWTATRPAPAS